MKILIWFLTFILCSIINVFIGLAIGFRAGYWLLYIVQIAVAKKLCDKWDKRKARKSETTKVSEVAKTPISENCDPQARKALPLDSVPNEATQVIVFCHKCGEKLVPKAKFCRKCGTAALSVTDIVHNCAE